MPKIDVDSTLKARLKEIKINSNTSESNCLRAPLHEIDVILPFHKLDINFVDALRSVQASNGVIVNLILVDDTKKVGLELEDIQKLIKLDINCILVRNESKGYAGGLNTGFRYTKSKFFGLMNSDDLVSPNKFSNQVEALLHSDAQICVGKIVKFSGKHKIPSLAGDINIDLYDKKYLLLGAYGADATIVGYRDILNQFKYDEKTKSSDWVTALIKYPNLEIIGDETSIYLYRLHNGQVSRDINHRTGNFKEVYPNWLEFNRAYGLPDLNYETANLIAAPSEFNNAKDVDLESLKIWKVKYLSLFNNTVQRRNVEQLLKRRIAIYVIRGGITSFDILVMLRLFLEFVVTKFHGTNPR